MSDELSFNGAEFAKPVENKGQYRKKRFMFLGLYVLFAALYLYLFLVPVKMPALIAILPLFIYILYLATWRYCNFEWLIRVNVGKITINHVFNKREKEKHSFMAKSIIEALPDTEENFKKLSEGAKVIDFRKEEDRVKYENDRISPFYGTDGTEPTIAPSSKMDHYPITEEGKRNYDALVAKFKETGKI